MRHVAVFALETFVRSNLTFLQCYQSTEGLWYYGDCRHQLPAVTKHVGKGLSPPFANSYFSACCNSHAVQTSAHHRPTAGSTKEDVCSRFATVIRGGVLSNKLIPTRNPYDNALPPDQPPDQPPHKHRPNLAARAEREEPPH